MLLAGVRVQLCHAAVCIEFAFWPLKRDDHSGILIGAGGTRRSDWSRACVLTRTDMHGARVRSDR